MSDDKKKKSVDVVLAILVLLLFLVLVLSIIFGIMKILPAWLCIGSPIFVFVLILIKIVVNHISKSVIDIKPKGRPEVDDIISPNEALAFVKKDFLDMGLIFKLDHKNSYREVHVVGTENHETKVYAMLGTDNHGNSYHVAIRGHKPDGIVFKKNCTNVEDIRKMEEGLADKSQLYIVEETRNIDNFSGREVVSKKIIPNSHTDEKDEKGS